MRVAVFGASGVQGKAQVAALVHAGHHPVAISRSPKPIEVDGKPVETAAADFVDSEALDRALSGVEAIFLNLPSTSFQKAEPVIAAAKNVGEAAKRTPTLKVLIFNTSMPVPKVPQNIEAQDHRREMRRVLRDLGLPVVSIEPVVFIDNLLEGWALPPIVERNTIVYCHREDLEVSWICHHDVAQLMIAAMERGSELAGQDIPVGGPETVRLAQLTEKLARAWNRPMQYESKEVDEFCDGIGDAMSTRSGLDRDVVVDQMRRAYRWYNDHPSDPFKVDMAPVLKELPVKLTPIEEWASWQKLPSKA